MHNYQHAYMDESSNQSQTLKYNNYYKLFTKLWKSYKCMDVQLYACACVHHLCTCMRSCYTSMYAYMLVACFYKMFPHTENYSLFQNNKRRSQ